MLNLPASCPTILVIIGTIVTVIGWPVSACFAYRLGFRSQRMRMEWEAQKAKQTFRKKFIHLADDLRTNVSERPDTWVDFFKDNVARLVSDYQTIRPELKWAEKKKLDEAMNSIKRFAGMNEDEIHAACRSDTELLDALKKFPEA
jgi:hypothetical protein